MGLVLYSNRNASQRTLSFQEIDRYKETILGFWKIGLLTQGTVKISLPSPREFGKEAKKKHEQTNKRNKKRFLVLCIGEEGEIPKIVANYTLEASSLFDAVQSTANEFVADTWLDTTVREHLASSSHGLLQLSRSTGSGSPDYLTIVLTELPKPKV